MRKSEGITLVSLIITIVLMLILASVSIGAISTNLIGKTKDISIQTSLEMVDTAIKLYKTEKLTTGMMERVDNNTLIQNGILKEYVIEETLRPIAVVEGYAKLRLFEDFGAGYKNIQASADGYIATLNQLEDVCAIDLTDGTLYYLNNGKIYSIDGKTEIANNFERVNADLEEWTFNESTKTLTAYNWDLTQVRGQQQAGELIIPNYYNGVRVSIIGQKIFQNNTAITKLTISKGIQTISTQVFDKCTNLKGDLIIPDSVTYIDTYVFRNCTSLDGNLKIPNKIEKIGDGAFQACGNLKGEILIPETCTSIGKYCFNGCKSLTGNLIIPDSVTKLGTDPFTGCSSLTGNLYIGNNITTLGSQCFSGCSGLTGDIIIPDSVTTISQYAFRWCSSFDGELKLGNNVKTIGTQAFYDCNKITGDTVISETVESIGVNAFYACNSLNSLKFLNKSTEIYDSAGTIASNIKIIGYAGSTAEAYATKYSRTFEAIQE